MVARDRIGCIMPKNMCLRKDLTEEIIANHFMMTHVFIMQPSTESLASQCSFATPTPCIIVMNLSAG